MGRKKTGRARPLGTKLPAIVLQRNKFRRETGFLWSFQASAIGQARRENPLAAGNWRGTFVVMSAKPVPDGYSSVTPYLVVTGAARMLDFLREAFGAREIRRFAKPDGIVGHAEVRIGDSVIMLADACPEFPATQAGVHLYLPEVDKVHERAVRAGAISMRSPADQFYGDRSAVVRDFSGNWWSISTHIKDISDEEMLRLAQSSPV